MSFKVLMLTLLLATFILVSFIGVGVIPVAPLTIEGNKVTWEDSFTFVGVLLTFFTLMVGLSAFILGIKEFYLSKDIKRAENLYDLMQLSELINYQLADLRSFCAHVNTKNNMDFMRLSEHMILAFYRLGFADISEIEVISEFDHILDVSNTTQIRNRKKEYNKIVYTLIGKIIQIRTIKNNGESDNHVKELVRVLRSKADELIFN